MRDNSGSGESKNNMRDAHIKDQERARGVSGEAIQGEKKVKASPSRKRTAKPG